ncbi:MAG: Na/Pi cotransporter family protein [Phycisphaerales bacterium]
MPTVILEIVGGIGCFLLGMSLLVDGLRSLAGGALRRILTSAVHGPISGFLAGAGATAIVQSSSATTVATIGFVSAGLLSFPQSIGVVLGANVGTTSTSWLVATLGFKISIGAFALPIVGIGAMLRVLGRGRLADIGLAIAGFGLLCVGLDLRAQGMAAASARLGPETLPAAGGLGGRALLLGAGFAMTVLMQSSSAAIATVLVALAAGTISYEQAIAVVVGANVGTTITAAIAMVGASVPAKRTALVHILFNVALAATAYFLLPWLGRAAWLAGDLLAAGQPTVAVACFHTLVKTLGAGVFLAATVPLARLLVAVVPIRDDALVRHLDRSVVTTGLVAIEALRRTILSILADAAASIESELSAHASPARFTARIRGEREAIGQASAFAAEFGRGVQGASESREHLGCLHALDHASRLLDGVGEPTMFAVIASDPMIGPQVDALSECLELVRRWDEVDAEPAQVESLARISATVAGLRKAYRVEVLEATAAGKVDPEVALARLDASRSIDQIAYHCWRASSHLLASNAGGDAPAP